VPSLVNGSWTEVRAYVHSLPKRLPRKTLPLAEVGGRILAEDVVARADVPNMDSSAMDGWAVAGEGPWRIAGSIEIGRPSGVKLSTGQAMIIGTGGSIPLGARAILRREHGIENEGTVSLSVDGVMPTVGKHLRASAEEIAKGDIVIKAGQRLNPIHLAVAASCGYDEISVSALPSLHLIVTGNEIDAEGTPAPGRLRDSFTPQFAGLCESVGADAQGSERVVDDREAVTEALRDSTADIVVTTGGTADGEADHVRAVLEKLRASILLDKIAVQPGHPTLLAKLPGGRFVVALAGNPLAAIVGFLGVVHPLVAGMTGAPLTELVGIELAEEVAGNPRMTRLVPYELRDGWAFPSQWRAASMLRGLAAADGMLVVEPGLGRRGDRVGSLSLPWKS